MSSSAAGTGAGDGDRPGGERRQSFTKFMTRARSALRRDRTKRRSSSGDVSGAETPSNTATPAVASPAEVPERNPVDTIPEQKEAKEPKQPETKGKQPDTKGKQVERKEDAAAAKKVDTQVTSRAALQQEKARALFEKYGLTLEPHEWATPPTTDRVERVQKPIRMRVHRQCHRCQTTFGVDKVCVQCGHKRCKTCPRYPVKKPKHAQEQPSKVAGVGGLAVAGEKAPAPAPAPTALEAERARIERKYRLTIPAKHETQDRVRKDVRQRVHRACHRCERAFARGEKSCTGCGHVRCTKCPRDPPKLHKYPNGYPGDAEAEEDEPTTPMHPVKAREYKKVRMIVKWHCHGCDAIFAYGSKICASCEHERCRECRRVPPKKVKPAPVEPDPEILQRVEERLANLRLSVKDEAPRDPVPAAATSLAGRDADRHPSQEGAAPTSTSVVAGQAPKQSTEALPAQ